MRLQQLLDDIDSRMAQCGRTAIAIDGMAASGKSTLAAYICEHRSCSVIPMDHFFLQPQQRTPQRLSEPGGNIDYERFMTEVILPLKSGEVISYCPYDCATLKFSNPVVLPPTQLTVVEGVYSLRPEFICAYDVCIFMELSRDTQLSRLRERSSEIFERFVDEWLPMEHLYFEHFDIKNICDYVLYGDFDPEAES